MRVSKREHQPSSAFPACWQCVSFTVFLLMHIQCYCYVTKSLSGWHSMPAWVAHAANNDAIPQTHASSRNNFPHPIMYNFFYWFHFWNGWIVSVSHMFMFWCLTRIFKNVFIQKPQFLLGCAYIICLSHFFYLQFARQLSRFAKNQARLSVSTHMLIEAVNGHYLQQLLEMLSVFMRGRGSLSSAF